MVGLLEPPLNSSMITEIIFGKNFQITFYLFKSLWNKCRVKVQAWRNKPPSCQHKHVIKENQVMFCVTLYQYPNFREGWRHIGVITAHKDAGQVLLRILFMLRNTRVEKFQCKHTRRKRKRNYCSSCVRRKYCLTKRISKREFLLGLSIIEHEQIWESKLYVGMSTFSTIRGLQISP